MSARLLRREALGAGVWGVAAAGDQVLAAYELLRHRIFRGAGWQENRPCFLSRQPVEGCVGARSTEHERYVRVGREGGFAMKVVVKLGGAALDNKEIVQKFATSIASLANHGHKVVVVHGGGAALTRTLKELGRKSEFINGLRVTDSET